MGGTCSLGRGEQRRMVLLRMDPRDGDRDDRVGADPELGADGGPVLHVSTEQGRVAAVREHDPSAGVIARACVMGAAGPAVDRDRVRTTGECCERPDRDAGVPRQAGRRVQRPSEEPHHPCSPCASSERAGQHVQQRRVIHPADDEVGSQLAEHAREAECPTDDIAARSHPEVADLYAGSDQLVAEHPAGDQGDDDMSFIRMFVRLRDDLREDAFGATLAERRDEMDDGDRTAHGLVLGAGCVSSGHVSSGHVSSAGPRPPSR